MAGLTRKYPQAAYAGPHKYLKQEWAFIQRATQVLAEDFRPVEKTLQEEFLPVLFLGAAEHMPDRTITGFPVKHAGPAILDLTLTAQVNWTASCAVTRNLVAALWSSVKFCSGDHTQLLTKGRADICSKKV